MRAFVPEAELDPIPTTFPDGWAERIFESLPRELGCAARERWMDVANTGPKYPGLRHEGLAPHAKANMELAVLRGEIDRSRFRAGITDAEIVDLARRCADRCSRNNYSGERLAEHLGLELRWSKAATPESIGKHFCDPCWWRRRLRKLIGRFYEELMRRRGLVRRGKAPYVADDSLRRWRGRRAANRRVLERSVAVNEDGAEIQLSALADGSISNPRIRRAEMMLRVRGLDEVATASGYLWTFATLTAPSAFHPALEAGGGNPRYEGHSAREAQTWLCKAWSRTRAQLSREGIQFFGIRVAEPHHDGTPHWHTLLFVSSDHIDRLEAVLRAQWLKHYGDEPGATEYRVKFVRYDPSKPNASAPGYLAKYIGKNIDGHGVDEDHDAGLKASDAAERATAWASLHGIRQFQQIGGPAIGLWRELRRVRESVAPPEIEAARVHTDKPASFSGFVDAIGGVHVGRATTLQLWKEELPELNRYGEARARRAIGVRSDAHRVRTRLHEWRIKRKSAVKSHHGEMVTSESCRSLAAISSDLGPVSITVRTEPWACRPLLRGLSLNG